MHGSDYGFFEGAYRQLRQEGAAGWGAQALERRVKGWKAARDFLVSQAEVPQAPARILELGCGAGQVSELFAELGYELDGFDISSTTVAWATERFAERGLKGRFRSASAVDLSAHYPDASFEVALDGNLLHCLIGRDRALALAEVRRVLRTEGIFWVSSMIGPPRQLGPNESFDTASRCVLLDGRPTRCMPTLAQLRAEVEAAGFEIIRETTSSSQSWDHATLLTRSLNPR